MRIMNTVRGGLAAVLAVGLVTTLTPSANAQGGGFGGGGMPPEIQAKIKKWQKWREQNKDITAFSDMIFQLGELNKTDAALDKKQSGQVASILKPWRAKTKMTNDDAKGLQKKISGLLTTKQLKKMATIETPTQRMQRGGFGGGGGGGRPGGGGPGGPGGGGGPRPGGGGPGGPGGRPGGFTFPDPPSGGMNPLNPDTLPFAQMRPQQKKRLDDFMADLEKRSK